jgi:hypothetical protein
LSSNAVGPVPSAGRLRWDVHGSACRIATPPLDASGEVREELLTLSGWCVNGTAPFTSQMGGKSGTPIDGANECGT